MQKRSFLIGVAAALFSFSHFALAADNVFRVGVSAGPHEQIMEKVKEVAARDGLTIEVFSFNNYILPNQALASKELDANSFQHKPYLDNQVKTQNLDLVSIGESVLLPMAVYSKSITSLDDLKNNAVVGIPNDPSNGGRALLLLQDMGLIKLDSNAGLLVTPNDIIENPKNLEIFELEAAQLPHSLGEFDIAIVNTNYALAAGLNPKKDSLFIEGVNSPYVNVIVVRPDNKDSPEVAAFMKAFHSDEVREFVLEEFDGAAIPAW